MSFVNPFLLIGILAAGVPLLIHLWNKRRARIVSFSSIKFLIERHRRRIKRLKLEQILILILRMLIVALIATAFARPILTGIGAAVAGDRAKSSVVIILDNSYSMSYEELDGVRFDLAKNKALSILGSLHAGDDASLVLMSDAPDVIFRRLTPDIQQVRTAINDARISHKESNVWPSVWESYSLLKESNNPYKAIYLITDLGENGWQNWREMPDSTETAGIFVVKVGSSEAENRAIESVLVSRDPVGMGMPVQISAKLNNSMVKSGTEAVVEMFVDGEKRGQALADKQSISFDYTFEHPGVHVGEFRLTSDRLSLDDVRYFAVEVLSQIKVLCAGEYRLYVNLALNPVSSLNPEEEFLILPIGTTAEELKSVSLDQYSVVFLTDLSRLPEDTVRDLESFVSNGGNLVVFLGEAVDREWYNNYFSLMPAILGNVNSIYGQSPALSRPLKLSSWNKEHPVFNVFRDESAAAMLADSPEFHFAFSMKPKPDTTVIAGFNKNIPAILEARSGRGRVILFNTSPNTRVSNLPITPVFLPLMQQIVFYLVSAEKQNNRNILVADTYVHNVEGNVDPTPEILGPESKSVMAAVSASERGSQIRYGPVERTGIYTLSFKSEGALRRDYFAVNLDTEGESILKAADEKEVADKLGKQSRFLAQDASPDQIATSIENRSELSSKLLIAAAILMLLEIPLANKRRI